jgi:hypothetical protein
MIYFTFKNGIWNFPFCKHNLFYLAFDCSKETKLIDERGSPLTLDIL